MANSFRWLKAGDAFVTLDKGLAYQQNLASRRIGVILIRPKSARLADLLPHAKARLQAIARIRPGEIIQVGSQK
jgi:hypothetical protein